MSQAADAGQQEGLAGQASEKAQEKATELREQGSERLRDQLDRRSNETGAQVRSLGQALRRSGSELGTDGNARTAQLTEQAADRIERVGTYLEQKSGDELMRDVEAFARRRPWMLAGIGMLTGIAAARFVKASSDRRSGSYAGAGRQWGAAAQPAPFQGELGVGRPASEHYAGAAG